MAHLIHGRPSPVGAGVPASLDGLADAFNTSNQASVNIRSKTALARFDDRDVHLKTSDIDLGVEAAALRDAATLGHHDDVRSVSLIAFDAGRNVLTTEHAEGESLFNVLWNSTSIRTSLTCRWFTKPASTMKMNIGTSSVTGGTTISATLVETKSLCP